jgi:hypothetical protein
VKTPLPRRRPALGMSQRVYLWLSLSLCLSLCLPLTPAHADTAGSAPAMLDAFAALQRKPGSHPFNQPLYLDSFEGSNSVRGEIYALVDAPYSAATETLTTPSQWCEVLILHLNTKFCRPQLVNGATSLQMRIGKKFDQPLADAYRLNFAFMVAARTAAYLQVRLSADEGPMGTSNYRLMLEAAPTAEGKTLIRLGYSYSFGTVGKLAMIVYLNTAGRNKVGFTMVGNGSDAMRRYIGGLRGVVERNTMRYFLAIDVSLRDAALPRQTQLERRLLDWFVGSERYPLQLHEMGQGEYMAMKRNEVARQQRDL